MTINGPLEISLLFKMDTRPYFFVNIKGSWCFIACNMEYKNNLILLENWDDKYQICRVCYTKEKAAELIASTGMMEGPNIYCVYDKNETVITVWKTRIPDMLEIMYGDNSHILVNKLSYDEIIKHFKNILNYEPINIEK